MKTEKLFLLATITALFFASQTMAQEPVKVHTEGLAAKIKFESVLAGFLSELNGKYKFESHRVGLTTRRPRWRAQSRWSRHSPRYYWLHDLRVAG
jgi:hypothetical protein